MITIKNVSKTYNGKDYAVKNLNLEIQAGEIFGLLGPNGAGKTTTIKMLVGILPPNSGNLIINGHDISSDPIAAKKSFAFVSDDPNSFIRYKGIEYLKFIADIYGVDPELRTQRVNRYAQLFEMEAALGDRIQSYSHGMRQKINLIAALIHNPKVWILDEPMTGLDPKSAYVLKQLMREHADQGNVVLFSTHVLEVAEKLCDRLAIIDKGNLHFCGTIDAMHQQFANNQSLEEMFLEMTGNVDLETITNAKESL